MLEKLNDLPPGVEGLSAVGKVSKEDYRKMFEPYVEAARRESRRLRFMYRFGPSFEGFTPSGALEDVRFVLSSTRFFERCAIVSDNAWIRRWSRLFGPFLPFPVRVFSDAERGEATEWLRALPADSAVSHRLLSGYGVLVVEVKRMLHAYDFDTLVLTVDTWLETHGELHGLVIHAHDYPGWENLSAFFRHLRFANDQHKRLPRVVLAGDGGVTSLAPQLHAHFVNAEVRCFEYDAIDDAVVWARGGRAAVGRSAAVPDTETKVEPRRLP